MSFNILNKKDTVKCAIRESLQNINNVFIPLIPGILGLGILLGIINILNKNSELNSYNLIKTINLLGQNIYYFLPIFIGMSSAKQYGGTPILSGIISILFVGKQYSIVASLIIGIIVSKIENKLKTIKIPLVIMFIKPFIILLIGIFIGLIVIEPTANILTKIIFIIYYFIIKKLGIVGAYIVSFIFLPLVSLGLHQLLIPINIILLSVESETKGINYLLPMIMMAGGGQIGAAIALYLKTKNEELKKDIKENIFPAIFGIGEGLMYTVTLPIKRVFITACLGAGVGGILIYIFKVGAISIGVSGILGLVIIEQKKWIYYIISLIGSYFGGFIFTFLFGINKKILKNLDK